MDGTDNCDGKGSIRTDPVDADPVIDISIERSAGIYKGKTKPHYGPRRFFSLPKVHVDLAGRGAIKNHCRNQKNKERLLDLLHLSEDILHLSDSILRKAIRLREQSSILLGDLPDDKHATPV